MNQGKVQDPNASPTGQIKVDPAVDKPVWFKWASEVNKALNLSPIRCDTMHPTTTPKPATQIVIDKMCTTAPQPIRTPPKPTVTP